jgi:hypothetical protein
MDNYVLKKDIVIPAGTVLNKAPYKTVRTSDHYDCIVGLSGDTSGVFTYDIDPSCEGQLEEWFGVA